MFLSPAKSMLPALPCVMVPPRPSGSESAMTLAALVTCEVLLRLLSTICVPRPKPLMVAFGSVSWVGSLDWMVQGVVKAEDAERVVRGVLRRQAQRVRANGRIAPGQAVGVVAGFPSRREGRIEDRTVARRAEAS